MSDEWIIVPNWDKYQSYKDENPEWIKNWLQLLHDPSYVGLQGHLRGVLHGLWMLYAASRERLPGDPTYLSACLHVRVRAEHLAELETAGFIGFSPEPPSRAHTRARTRERAQETSSLEKEKSAGARPRTREGGAAPAPGEQPRANADAYRPYDPDDPPPDPEFAQKLREMTNQIGRSM